MSSELFMLLGDIEREKGISREVVLEALDNALASAYRKNYGATQDVGVKINQETGEIKVFAKKTVVEDVEEPDDQILLADAQAISEKYKLGDVVEFEVTPDTFGRIAAQTARQVVLQRIREAEREKMFDEFSGKQNDIVNASITKIERRNVMLELENTESILAPNEQVAADKYTVGGKYKVYVVEVLNSVRGPHMVVSRSHPGLVRRLFELEVPEIAEGIIEIKALSREPGSRSKMAVYSNDPNIDPVGTCIGVRGGRVQSVISELRGEKIDIVRYSDDPAEYIKNALSPASVVDITINEELKECKAIVPHDQLSLAIGREGQNVRLAARLMGWKIDISSDQSIG